MAEKQYTAAQMAEERQRLSILRDIEMMRRGILADIDALRDRHGFVPIIHTRTQPTQAAAC